MNLKQDRRSALISGRRQTAKSENSSGRYAMSRIPRTDKTTDIAFDATIRAAAPYQLGRKTGTISLVIKSQDIREKVREKKTGSTIVFVVDSSGSMGANRRMAAVKGAILSLLLDAYQKRDRVAMVAFKGNDAEIILPLTDSIELGKQRLETLPTGGKTPLSKGLLKGYDLLIRELHRNSRTKALMVVISDGRANVGISESVNAFKEALNICEDISASGIQSIIIDTETGLVRLGKMHELADHIHGAYFTIESIKADTVADIVKGSLSGIF